MGVKSCSRPGCSEIMCDTYVDGVGYVCCSCEREFCEHLLRNKIEPPYFDGQLRRELKNFMSTDKDDFANGQEITLRDFFEKFR